MAPEQLGVGAPVGNASDEAQEARPVLVDKSAWEQRRHSDLARRKIDQLAAAGRAATCLPVVLEQLYSARNAEDFASRRAALELLQWLPVTPAVENEAIQLMARMARKGQHRMPLPDVMIAATAAVHDAVVLHYDRDFERIAVLTGQPHEWIVPRGTGHGRDTEP